MNPLYAAVVAAVIGKQRKCARCGKKQIVRRPRNDDRIHCARCGHPFSKKELKGGPK